MKLSFMSFTCPEATLDEFLGYAQKYGFDGVEPRAEAGHAHGVELEATPAQRREIARRFADSGIACACIATSRRYCFADQAERRASIELSKRYIELAADVGCPRLRVFGGPLPEGMTMEEAIAIVGESLAELAPFAEQHGTVLCLETHDAFMRADDCAAAVRIANSPAIGVNWDIMHPFTKGMSIDEAYNHLRGLIHHCHIHDGTYPPGGGRPTLAKMGEGDIPYRRAVALLAADGYKGFLSGEWINAWPPDEILPHDGRVLREYIAAARPSDG